MNQPITWKELMILTYLTLGICTITFYISYWYHNRKNKNKQHH